MKRFFGLVFCVFSIFVLTACDGAPFSRGEVEALAKDLLPGVEMEFLGVDEVDGEGRPISWNFREKGGQGLSFSVRAALVEDSKFGDKYDLVTDYYFLLTQKALSDYPGPKEGFRLVGPRLVDSDPRLLILYKDLEGLEKACGQASDFYGFLRDKYGPIDLVGLAIFDPGDYPIYQGVCQSLSLYDQGSRDRFRVLMDQVDYDLSIFLGEHGIYQGTYSREKIVDSLALFDQSQFTIRGPQGQAFYWGDMVLGDHFGNILSLGNLYGVLSRMAYPSLEGDPGNFHLVGQDGRTYGFSKDFYRDLGLDLMGKREDEALYPYNRWRKTYFTIDGAPQERTFDLEDFEAMTGYSLERGLGGE